MDISAAKDSSNRPVDSGIKKDKERLIAHNEGY
jgi:hypothetical protein